MSNFTEDMTKAMKWAKWPILVLMLILTVIIVAAKPEADSQIGRLFGYYFQLSFAFAVMSCGFGVFYMASVLERMSNKYPAVYQQLNWPRSPIGVWQILKLAKNLGDDTLSCLSRRGLFWFYGSMSLLATVPMGMIIFLTLV